MAQVKVENEVLPVRIDPDVRVAIAAAAKKRGQTVSEFVRDAIASKLQQSDAVADKIADRLHALEMAIGNICNAISVMQDERSQVRENVAILMRRQEKMRATDATILETVQKLGILTSHFAKPLGLPKVLELLVADLQNPDVAGY